MPFESDKQRRLMYAAAENPEVAKKAGIPQHVARKFIEDSTGHKLAKAMKKRKK
jgi:hypothetical protein